MPEPTLQETAIKALLGAYTAHLNKTLGTSVAPEQLRWVKPGSHRAWVKFGDLILVVHRYGGQYFISAPDELTREDGWIISNLADLAELLLRRGAGSTLPIPSLYRED